GTLGRLGMPIYGCPTPDGYKNTEDAWLSPDATTLRIGFATGLARGALPLAAPPSEPTPILLPAVATGEPQAPPPPKSPPVEAAPLEQLLLPVLDKQTLAAIAEAPPGLHAAMVLGSPDFMRH